MAFRKRNVAIGQTPTNTPSAATADVISGVRPSPLTSQPVTSTGTPSLDGLLGGHTGLALGSSLLIEESGTTDFAGALLRYYAAEGLCHGHAVHVVGVGEQWIRELPGTAEEKRQNKSLSTSAEGERMKIAWRYERLGQAGERALPDRNAPPSSGDSVTEEPFCHAFDLTKRLVVPDDAKISHISISAGSTFEKICQSLSQSLAASPPHIVHRLILPSILSPALYPPTVCRPESFLNFLRALRVLLHQYPTRLTAMITLPLALYPRSTGLVRWAEILSGGVIELTPFPHLMDSPVPLSSRGGSHGEEQPQGMVKFHKLPITTERGEGGAGVGNSIGEDLAFTVSRRKFAIEPFSLPPVEGDQEAQKESGRPTGQDVQF